ncbi:unnamed protein product [Ostreobium quekettii]|uniref:non-specific serine/threonine protein kinase n=1 Tax=Ostreobium quekettii TaxID=121088 RepID=A0A8S1JCK8_9CHLO|nr:unnamed protein product [Ostreobium quekettii]|eukprot:evm.model.scf_1689.1 EVM.evm.TU.scf_1689.1   scf_1689:6292-12573(+)
MAGPAFPALPQTSSMRATDSFAADDGGALAALSHRSRMSDASPKQAPSPMSGMGGDHVVGRQLSDRSPSERSVETGGEEEGGDKSSREGANRGAGGVRAKAPRVPRSPLDSPDSGAGGKLSSNKIAKLRKRFAKASVDLNVELDPTGRFTRSNQVLGKGSSKVVYKGFDRDEGMEIAWNQVKIPGNLTPRARARLMNEIEVLKRLKHKSIMKFYSSWIDTQNNHLNFITEYFHPGPLRRHRRAHKCMPRNVLKRWAWQILQGLVYLHGHQPPIIHRDLKCDNIFIHGVTGEVKIGDLGLAKLMEEGLSTCQSVLGTPEFMAPELYHGIYNEKVDIYAYGMCMLELVTMQFPYMECKNRAQIFRHVSMGIHPASLKKIDDRECQEFIELCINHFHERRPQARQLVKHPFFDDIRNECKTPGPIQTHLALKKNSNVPKPPQMPKKSKGKRTFELTRRGATPNTTKLELELNMISASGAGKLFMFQFDLDTDTVETVAMELQEEFGLSEEETEQFTELLAGEIENKIDEERRDTMTHIQASLGPLDDFVAPLDNGPVVGDMEGSDATSESEGEEIAAALPAFATDSAMSPTMRGGAGLPGSPVHSPVRSPAGNQFSPQHVQRSAYSDDNGQYDPYQRAVVEQRGQSDYRYDNADYYAGLASRQPQHNPFRPSQGSDFAEGIEMKAGSPQGGFVASAGGAPAMQYMDRAAASQPAAYDPSYGGGRLARDLGRDSEKNPTFVESCASCTASTAAWCASAWDSVKASWPWFDRRTAPDPSQGGTPPPTGAEGESRFKKIGTLVGTISRKLVKKEKSQKM